MIIFNIAPLQRDVFLFCDRLLVSSSLSSRLIPIERDTDSWTKHEQDTNTKEKLGKQRKRNDFTLHTCYKPRLHVIYAWTFPETLVTAHVRSVFLVYRAIPLTPYTCHQHDNRNSRTRYTQFLLRMRGCIVPIDGVRTKRTKYRFLG